jgi:hypothetical protein
MTGVSHLKKVGQSVKTPKTTLSAGKVTASDFWDSLGVSFIDFLIEQRTINESYYSKLRKDRVKPAFCSNDEINQSKASVSPKTMRVSTPLL